MNAIYIANEEHTNATKVQTMAMLIKLRSRGWDIRYGTPIIEGRLEEIDQDDWNECLAEALAEIPEDADELPQSYNAGSISHYL